METSEENFVRFMKETVSVNLVQLVQLREKIKMRAVQEDAMVLVLIEASLEAKEDCMTT